MHGVSKLFRKSSHHNFQITYLTFIGPASLMLKIALELYLQLVRGVQKQFSEGCWLKARANAAQGSAAA